MESTKVFVDNVDRFLSRIPAVIAQHQTPFFANYGYNPTYHFDVPSGAATMTAHHDRLQALERLHKQSAPAWPWPRKTMLGITTSITRSTPLMWV
ncbi:hypothetical protein V1520DRAFT_358882 [Lipomyces starkeyi]